MGVPQLCWRKMDVMEPLLRRCCAGTLWRSNFIEDYLVLPFNNELLRRLRDSRQFFVRRPWSICSSTSRRRQRSSTTPPSNAISNVRDSIVCLVIKNVQTRVCVCRDANVLSMNSRKVNRVSILFNNFFSGSHDFINEQWARSLQQGGLRSRTAIIIIPVLFMGDCKRSKLLQ